MAEDIDRFIQEQKRQLARERNELQQESARKVLEPASSNNPGPGINGFKENIPPSDKGVALETSKALPVGSHDNLRNKLAKERHDEYQRFLEEKEKRSGTRSQPQAAVDGGSLNIPSRDSAKDRSRVARNKEYNEFLKNKGGSTSRKPRVGNDELSPGITHRGAAINPITGDPVAAAKPSPPAQPNSHPPSDLRAAAPPQDRFADIQTRREAASQTPRPILRDYDDRPPPGPPGGPRRGWGTPNPDYDEILRRKREEEARYRRYDDDLDYYQPRGGIRPSYSDPHLNRYPPEDGRYSRARNDYYDQEYDRRRVRFSDERNPNDRGYPPPSNVRYDRPPANRAPGDGRDVLSEPLAYDWNISRGGRSRTLPEMERQRSNVSRADDNTDSRPPRAKSATLSNDEVGIAIGNRDTASATRRKKDQYRKELEQQMKEAQEAKKREKQEGLRINATGANDPAKKAQGFGGYASSRGPSRTPVPNQQPPAQAPPPQQQAGNQPARYQPSFRNQAYPTGQGPPGPALGLEEAISRSRLGDAPMIERPFSLNTYQPPLNATSTDPYMYYGVRNPLDPDPDNIRTARTWIDSMSRSLSRTGGAIVGKDGDTFSAFMTDVEIAEANLVNQGVPRQPQTPRQQPAGVLTRYDGHQVQQPLTPRQGRRQTQNASQLSSPFATNEELENPPPVQNTITGRRTPRQHNQPKTVLKPPTITGVISGGAGPQQAKGKVSFTLPDPSELPHRGYDQLTQATRQFQQTYNRAAKAGVPVNNAPQENLSLLNASKTAQIRGESSIKNFVGDTTLSPRSLNDPKSYQAILKQQMEEKERKKRIEKEEQERYDAKLEAQAAEYNPWGKGGGGAPMRDNKGKIVADLRQLHQHNEQALNDPASTQLQLYADQPLAGNTTTTAAAVTADRSPRPGATEPQPVTSASKDPKDEYKEYLKQQVEDKKRREAALKEKIRLEEEKEERRLEQQRIKMQRDFEVEQQRMKDKEEEKVRQAQELERKIEEQKKEAEKKKHDVIEARRREGEEDRRKQEQAKNEQKERYSPPIPALRNKENQNPPRQSSPPIPTLRKKKEEEKKDSPRAANKIHGTPRQPPGRGSWSEHAKVLAPNPRQKEPKNKPRIESPPGDTFTDFLIDVSKEPGPVKQNWQSDMYKKAVNIAEEHLLHVQQEQEGTSKDGPDGAGRDPRDVMTALSAMRRQLHSEQRRIQSQLDRNKEHDPYSGHKLSSRRASPQVDVFEVARHKAPVAVRREPLTHHAAAAEFSSLKNRESNSRLRLREQFPDQPSSDLTLEAQQRALLRHQQEKLDNLRRGAKSKRPLEEQMPSMDLRDLGRNDSPLLALESESAFIGINNGVADIPNTPPHRKKPPSPRRDYGEPSTSVAKPKDPLGSTMSFDNDTIDYLAQKNKDRNKALRQLEDNTSLVDPDDVLQRFMMRDSHDRPKSGKSEDLSLWLQPTVSDY
ncbi:centrosome and spindle pole associated protein 1-like isoform X17 [Patiria miniata]|uniref:Centrosome and spindle pole-associated protein 1 C-terminal domain-containing protein n=1 Tax=Patiria miniata TaxID=46514 RepID=A0A914A061_PATMI|nr:centrosome and spindle pole associated protein 1-like isoform X17 [Patiria miniata]